MGTAAQYSTNAAHVTATSAAGRAATASLYSDAGATLDDLREAVTTLEDTERTARRVLGGAHPITLAIERRLRGARAALRALWCPRIAVFEEFCELGASGDNLTNFVS